MTTKEAFSRLLNQEEFLGNSSRNLLSLFCFNFRLNVNDTQETCQKNATSAMLVGRKDLVQVLSFPAAEALALTVVS